MIKDDQLFVEQFEALTIKPDTFNHIAHLRLAFLYIDQAGVEVAVNRVSDGIRTFATHVGATQKYHQTITEALVRLIGLRLQQRPVSDWQTFLAANLDLVEDARGVLLQYYSSDRLFSNEAQSQFITPDLMPLEA